MPERAATIARDRVLKNLPQASRPGLLPAMRDQQWTASGVVPYVECEHDAIRIVTFEPVPEFVWLEDGQTADHHPRDTGREQCGKPILRADASADLQRESGQGSETRDQVPVRRRAVARAVEIDDVQSSDALGLVSAREFQRVAWVVRLGVETSLQQTHAAPASQINGGDQLHAGRARKFASRRRPALAERSGWTPLDLARAYLDGGAQLLQIRAKHLASGRLLDLCDSFVRAADSYFASIVVNDRADRAALSRAAGVHVGQEDLAPADARRLLGAEAIVGTSTHTAEQIEAALREPISYLAVGPVFGTQTKDTGYSAVGLELVSTAARLAGPIPVVAIGGITIDTMESVLQAGATSVAVIGDLLSQGNPRGRVAAYLQCLAQHRV